MTPLERFQLLTDEQYLEAVEENGDEFDARMGAEAVYELLRTMDISKEIARMRHRGHLPIIDLETWRKGAPELHAYLTDPALVCRPTVFRLAERLEEYEQAGIGVQIQRLEPEGPLIESVNW